MQLVIVVLLQVMTLSEALDLTESEMNERKLEAERIQQMAAKGVSVKLLAGARANATQLLDPAAVEHQVHPSLITYATLASQQMYDSKNVHHSLTLQQMYDSKNVHHSCWTLPCRVPGIKNIRSRMHAHMQAGTI